MHLQKRLFVVLVAVLAGGGPSMVGGVPVASAGGLSHEDRLASLWSGRFAFSPEGVPQVRIGISEGVRKVEIRAAGAVAPTSAGKGKSTSTGTGVGDVLVWPSSPEGEAEVAAGGGWTVRVLSSRPAVIRWMVALERLPRRAGARLLVARVRKWRERGVEPRVLERGAVFGVGGRVLDTRERVLCLPGSTKHKVALKMAADARRRYRTSGALFAHIERPATGRLELKSRDGSVRMIVEDAVWFGSGAPGGTLSVGVDGAKAARYRGTIYVTIGRGGKLVVVNTVDTEEMLLGLVPAEMFPTAPLEALAAQAVSARGHLLSRVGRVHRDDPYMLCSNAHCQVYAGVEAERERGTKAVRASRGEVLFGARDLVPTYYSASCGGLVESCETVWNRGPHPHLKAGLDAPAPLIARLAHLSPSSLMHRRPTEAELRAFLAGRPAAFCARTAWSKSTYRWKVHRKASRLTEIVGASHPEIGSVTGLRPAGRGRGGRLTALEVIGVDGKIVVGGEKSIRKILGGLKSGLFVVDTARGTDGAATAFTFTGGGFGHGVGLCQIGAIGMALAGRSHGEILTHYFTASTLRRLY